MSTAFLLALIATAYFMLVYLVRVVIASRQGGVVQGAPAYMAVICGVVAVLLR